MAVKIVTDTTAGLPAQFIEEHDIAVLPQIVIFGEQSFRDDSEIDTLTFLRKLKESNHLPKTAAPPPAMYLPIFERQAAGGHSILVITPTAEASGTYRAALAAVMEFNAIQSQPAQIHVFDSRTVSGPMATLVELAVEWAETGEALETILPKLSALAARQKALILVDTLEYLHKGGRIGGAQALVGSLLQVKPILQLKDGRVEPFESQRTHRKALHRLEELVLQSYPHGREGYLSVLHSGASPENVQEAEWLAADLAARLNIEHPRLYTLPPAILVHAGPGVLAAGWFS